MKIGCQKKRRRYVTTEGFEYEILKLPDSYKSIELLKPNEFNLKGNLVFVPVKIVKNSGRVIKSIITIKVKIFYIAGGLLLLRILCASYNFSAIASPFGQCSSQLPQLSQLPAFLFSGSSL